MDVKKTVLQTIEEIKVTALKDNPKTEEDQMKRIDIIADCDKFRQIVMNGYN